MSKTRKQREKNANEFDLCRQNKQSEVKPFMLEFFHEVVKCACACFAGLTPFSLFPIICTGLCS